MNDTENGKTEFALIVRDPYGRFRNGNNGGPGRPKGSKTRKAYDSGAVPHDAVIDQTIKRIIGAIGTLSTSKLNELVQKNPVAMVNLLTKLRSSQDVAGSAPRQLVIEISQASPPPGWTPVAT